MGVNSLCYIDVLQDTVDSYNNTYHKSIERAAAAVSLLNVGHMRRSYMVKLKDPNQKPSSLKRVITSDLACIKRLFRKGYKMNWTEEVFQIVNQIPRTLVVYEVNDLLERPIEGTFYEKELQKVEHPDIFHVEKVLKNE